MKEENDVDDAELLAYSLAAHGVLFKKAVRKLLEAIRPVTVLSEEYPVSVNGRQSAIDLLVEFYTEGALRYVLPIECKRVFAETKRWIFFHSREAQARMTHEALYDERSAQSVL